MRRVDFDLGQAALGGVTEIDFRVAQRVLDQHRSRLQEPGVIGTWVGARASTPYVMVALRAPHSEELCARIPDALDGVSVYYIEGSQQA